MWRLNLSQKFMENHNAKTGIEGLWSSFFEMFKNALDSNSLGLEENTEGGLDVKIYYPLMEGARICGKLKLETEHMVRGIERQTAIQMILLRIAINSQGIDPVSKMMQEQNNHRLANINIP